MKTLTILEMRQAQCAGWHFVISDFDTIRFVPNCQISLGTFTMVVRKTKTVEPYHREIVPMTIIPVWERVS